MADIKMLLQNYVGQDDDQTDDDDYSKYYESSMLDQANPDDLLSPLEKLRRYCTSENIFTRQMVARSIVETVQSITNEQECLSLLEIITKLSDDIEPSVRCELMEQLPPCSMVIVDMKIVPDAISTFILPVMVKNLTDINNQVRKLSQNALLQLMDQDLIKKDDVESQICPVILILTEPESSDDFRTEAVSLMTKIACLLGSEVTEKLFLERFGKLCTDALFHVRKVCASTFGEMASVVRGGTTEKHLLPLFARLCEDGVWGVRKACAETFMSVSGICSKNVRYQNLSPLFVGLLCDKSRWVQMAAYQALGQFIATFAEPERSGFQVTVEGLLVPYDGALYRTFDIDPESNLTSLLSEDQLLELDRQTRSEADLNDALKPDVTDTASSTCEPLADDTSETFNNFEFWRTPLPNVNLADDLIDSCPPTIVLNDIKYFDISEVSQNANKPNEFMNDVNNTNSTVDDNCTASITQAETQGGVVNQGEAVKTYVIIDSSIDATQEENMNTEDIGSENMNSEITSLENTSSENTTCTNIENNSTVENESDNSSLANNENNFPSVRIQVENGNDDNLNNIYDDMDNRTHENCVSNDIMSHDETFESVNDFYGISHHSDDENSDDGNSSTLKSTSHYSTTLISNQCLHNQNIVPPALLEHFISMTEPSKAQTIDGDLPRHCAFTLPGVVLALGRENWNLLRDTYIHLSTDMQWKVRRTLAFSIHDLALILGQEICVEDLVRIFNQFLKDLDEVRVGILKHLFDFINILPVETQKDYLPVLCEFQKTDNSRNWRFRKDLSEQLICLVNLYNEEELAEYLCPVALELASDKVADVRENSYNLLCILLQKLYDYEDPHLFQKFATSINTLGTHQHWVKRKACAQIYSRFLEMSWYDTAHFARDFLQSLISLCTDPVPNVRLISSKSLLLVSKSDYYQCLPEADEFRKQVDRSLEVLQLDDDRDVRYFSGGKVEERISNMQFDQLDDTILLDQVDEDGNIRYYSGGKVEEKFSNMTLEMALDVDSSDSFSYSHNGVRIIQRGIHEYAINDDDDDETELVEEVYIEETLDNTNDDGDIVMEEFYMENPSSGNDHKSSVNSHGQYYIEEIIEEVILQPES